MVVLTYRCSEKNTLSNGTQGGSPPRVDTFLFFYIQEALESVERCYFFKAGQRSQNTGAANLFVVLIDCRFTPKFNRLPFKRVSLLRYQSIEFSWVTNVT